MREAGEAGIGSWEVRCKVGVRSRWQVEGKGGGGINYVRVILGRRERDYHTRWSYNVHTT